MYNWGIPERGRTGKRGAYEASSSQNYRSLILLSGLFHNPIPYRGHTPRGLQGLTTNLRASVLEFARLGSSPVGCHLTFMGLFMVSTGWKTSMWANPGRGFDSHRLHHSFTDLDKSKTVHGAMRPPETWACHKTAYCFYVDQRDEQHDKTLTLSLTFPCPLL